MDPDTILMWLRTYRMVLSLVGPSTGRLASQQRSDFPTPRSRRWRRRRESGSLSSGACPGRSTGIDCPSARGLMSS
ncbi:unnamed protein product [Musa acuminata subsp. malaccensis]|uniref:(wild Malaysian banana) hypothetical protein n=1 Tax=Musa acuminata subsp. malaccensis TaxID=214687 RepID=A0A804HPS9_MUSAM|nr:unnamed protein product [Musa acuminata subsp. malaccensis]